MKHLLLYGDSNTWGYVPGRGSRFAEKARWSGVLAHALGDGVRVVEEGLNGRTTVFDDPLEDGKNGKTYLQPCLASHRPLDLVVLLLGTNDLKHRFGLSAFDIGEGIRSLAELVLASQAGLDEDPPELLLVAPPHLNPEGLGEAFEGGVEKSHDLARYYLKVAEELGCHFFDAAMVVASSPLDGVHLDEQAHRALGVALAEQVRRLFALVPTPDDALDVHLANLSTGQPTPIDAPTLADPDPTTSAGEGLVETEPREAISLTDEEGEKVQAMRSSVGKLTVALGERGKAKEAREVFEAHGFDPDTTDLELGRRVYGALRALLKP